jgi:hypothetical protein
MSSSDDEDKVEIYPINTPKTMLEYFNSLIPSYIPYLPLSILMIGSRQSGKTTCLVNLVSRFYSKIYKPEHVYIFSPSVFLDPQYQLIKGNKYETFDSNLVEELMNDLKKCIKRYGQDRSPRHLFLLDDIISDPSAHNSYSLISKLYISGRHFNCDVILLTQSITMVAPVIRKNSLAIISFNLQEAEKEILLKEFGSRRVKKEFYQMLEDCFDHKYNSLYINVQAHNKGEKYIKNFNEFVSY